MKIRYPLAKPYFGGREKEYVGLCLDSGWVAHDGKYSKQLKKSIKKLTGATEVILQSNCTSALHAAMLSKKIGPGDEIIVADFTFPATGHAVKMCGATPIFVDVIDEEYTIDPSLIEKAITPQTKGIIPVHLFGAPCKMNEILKIAKKHELFVIEDCACAMGTKYNDKHVGTFGAVGCFSMHARKGLTTGEGGFSICSDINLAKNITSYSLFGREQFIENNLSKQKFTKIGHNYKLSDIQAAVGFAQLEKYDEYIKKRKKLVAHYLNTLQEINELSLPKKVSGHTWQSFVIVVNNSIERDKLILKLLQQGIQTQIGTYASHLQSAYSNKKSCPVSAKLFNKSLALPLYHEMTNADIEYIVNKLKINLQNDNFKR